MNCPTPVKKNYGPPRFLDRSVRTLRPQPPREVRWLHLPVASPSIAGFITIWQSGHFHWSNEAARVRFRYGSCVRLTRLHQRGLLHTHACSATLMNGLFQGKLLSAYKIDQALPGAPDWTNPTLEIWRFEIPKFVIRSENIG